MLVLLFGAAETGHAQAVRQVGDPVPYERIGANWQDCGLRKIDKDAFVARRLPREKIGKQAASFEVDYGPGFTSRAREAFARAVRVWEASITSPVAIRIDASFEGLGPGVLGGTRPGTVFAADTDGDGEADTMFGDALFDALTGQDQRPGESDIIIRFNSERDDWHFGDGNAPSGTIDFTSVVLHEIAHGLDYFNVTGVDGNGVGQYGGVDFPGLGEDGNPDGIPYVFVRLLDRQGPDGGRTALTNESVFPNPSQELGDALTGNALVFDADSANVAATRSTGPIPPKVYAPAQYQTGSSISHLDEQTYPFEGANALMTPRINAAETNRLPGPVVCGQLFDMGWPAGGECLRHFQDVFGLQIAEGSDVKRGEVTLDWDVRDDAHVQEYVIEKRSFDGEYQPVKRVDPAAGPPVAVDSLGLGRFEFRVRWVAADGSEQTTAQSIQVETNLTDLTAEPTGRDEEGRATVEVAWTLPPGTRGFTYQVERAAGSDEPFRAVGVGENRQFRQQRVTPGQYRYRVVARDGQGNQVTSPAASTNISFDGDVFVDGPYPQPAQDQARLTLTAKETQETSIEVYNTVGERVYAESRVLGASEATPLTFDTRRWGSGLYFLRVSGRQFTTTQKVVVVH